jgi:RHS repeat-associated protein
MHPLTDTEVYQETHYYPFGMTMEGEWQNIVNGPENNYLYNGKELNSDFGLDWSDYGARYYDASIGRWGQVDPLAEDYQSYSPYNYTLNNPIKYIDPDGRSVYGDYYSSSGKWLASDGKNDDKAYVVSTASSGGHSGVPVPNIQELTVSNSELLSLAATSYGESGVQNNTSEVNGIASAIVNNQGARGEGATIEGTIAGFALAAEDGNARHAQFNKTSSAGRNGTFMEEAIGAAINATNGGTDYSNGGTHWAGTDIGSKSEKRATGGLNFTDASHDMNNLGSKTAKGAPKSTYWRNSKGKATGVRGTYNYTWESTAAHGGTTFMKKTDKFINATGAPRY